MRSKYQIQLQHYVAELTSKIDYSKAVKALAVLAFALSIAFLRASASLRARNSDFMPGAAIRHTLKPKIAPLESVNHNGIPRK